MKIRRAIIIKISIAIRASGKPDYIIKWEEWVVTNEANGVTEAREMLNWWKAKVDAAWAAR
ncbi:MAG: hypothetical protein PHU23_03975 [Dehalococcoidales bacterium]|nr:hypothetical protein [Dehalococcoidales bacterium]